MITAERHRECDNSHISIYANDIMTTYCDGIAFSHVTHLPSAIPLLDIFQLPSCHVLCRHSSHVKNEYESVDLVVLVTRCLVRDSHGGTDLDINGEHLTSVGCHTCKNGAILLQTIYTPPSSHISNHKQTGRSQPC